MGELIVHGSRDQGLVVVDVEGDLDPLSVMTLQNELLAAQVRNGDCLVVRLTKVSSCDLAALATLVVAKRAAAAAGAQFVLVAPSYRVAWGLRVTGLARNLEIRPTLQAAYRQPGNVPRQRSGGASPAHAGAQSHGANTASARG